MAEVAGVGAKGMGRGEAILRVFGFTHLAARWWSPGYAAPVK
jgi:hypothetical protein